MMLYLIRHGKTGANEQRLYCGHTDIPLSERGRAELCALKSRIGYPKAGIYIVSGLKRTLETLECLYGSERYLVFPEFMEMNFGAFEMRSYDELKDDAHYKRWIGDMENEACRRGEGQKQFKERVNKGILKAEQLLAGSSQKSAVIITHGGVIASIMEWYFPGVRDFFSWQPDFGRGYTILAQEHKEPYYKGI